MKYDAIIFDYGATLAHLDKRKFLFIPTEICWYLQVLHHRGYRLGIISNTSQAADGPWNRKRLDEWGILYLFETTLWVWKPEQLKPHSWPFKQTLEILGLPGNRCLMVGDTPQADGEGAKKVGMAYFRACVDEKIWVDDLEHHIEGK